MIGSATKKTLVHGGAGLERNDALRSREGLGDMFADSISSALERLVGPPPRTRNVPLGMEASVAPLVQADDDEEDDPMIAEAAPSHAGDRWGVSAWGRDRAPDAAKITSPSQLYAASAGGMAVWEGSGLDARGPFSEPPLTASLFEGGPTPEAGPTLATAVVRELEGEPLPLVTRRTREHDEEIRSRPTRPEELAGEPAARTTGGIVARVGTVRVGSPEVRERVVRLRPPSADAPALPTSPPAVSSPSPRPRLETRAEGAERPRLDAVRTTESRDGREGRGTSDRDERRDEAPHERSRTTAHTHGTRKSQGEAERPFTTVHAVPLVTVGDGGASLAASTLGGVGGAYERTPLAIPVVDGVAANGPAEARADGVPYQVVRLDDRTARVELVHPELGRVQVEVHTEQGRVDVELLARSLSASIALRASEPELRGDLRQRGASLRNYRVRTAPDGVASAGGERQR